jgi:hypothetical protein
MLTSSMRFSTAARLPSSAANLPMDFRMAPRGLKARTGRRLVTVFMALGVVSQLVGCAVSRYDELKSMSGRVEKSLRSEQRRVVGLADDPSRGARLDHLSQLKYTLSAANVGLGAIPYAIEEAQRPIAYDVIEEVYSTIEWNIPLGPTDAKKPLPRQFSTGTLKLDNAPSTGPAAPAPITPQRR